MLVGVLGGGQLGRMLALAGLPLGLHFRFLDPDPEAPARAVGELINGRFDDEAALARFAAGLDVATFEFENVPDVAVRRLAQSVPVHPGADALAAAQDRISEKSFFQRAGLEVHPYRPVEDRAGLEGAVGEIGVPAVLKTRRGGYDGKGQAVIRSRQDVDAAWAAVGGRPCILEALIPFSRELSIIAVRGADGAFAAYPLVENHHLGGILRTSIAPAQGVPPEIEKAADEHCRTLMQALDYVGVLAVEFFEHEGRLLANEMAPRVHNSGHWTIEGAVTSQFENHIRAVCGLPLGSTDARGHSVMINLIGGTPQPAAVLRANGAHLHLYGKAARPRRKVGHVTVTGEDAASVRAEAQRVQALVRPG